jgi:hypothetical protein
MVLPSMGMFVAMYVAFEANWTSKLNFEARFESDDLFHRVWTILMGSVISFQSNSISNYEEMADPSTYKTIAFSSCILVYALLDLVPYIELSLTSVSETHLKNVQQAGVVFFVSQMTF